MWYERAVKQFSMDHTCVLAEHEQWVDCEVVADIAHASKAAQLKAEEDKKRHKVEEAKLACDMGEHPKKWGQANTAGLSIAEVSTSRAKKALKVCTYCTK